MQMCVVEGLLNHSGTLHQHLTVLALVLALVTLPALTVLFEQRNIVAVGSLELLCTLLVGAGNGE